MKTFSYSRLAAVLAVAASAALYGCGDDSPTSPNDELRSTSFTHAFNEGQALGAVEVAYRGDHERNLSAQVTIEERADGNADITVELRNTLSGVTYATHVHDFADPETTPNNTPYNETPNGNLFAGGIEGTGGTASATNETSVSYDDVIEHGAFFVVHDPLQELSTVDLTTYLVLGVFGENLPAGELALRSESYTYGFNEGQLLDDATSGYDGGHARDLMAELLIEERADGGADVTVTLTNTLDGEAYPVHAHDFADPETTPNNTPYNETPNGNVFAGAIMGTGATASLTNETDMNYLELVEEYGAFLVVHDPTQDISTVDFTTYLVLGVFAESLEATSPPATLTLQNVGASAYRLAGIAGTGASGAVGSENPEIELTIGARFTFANEGGASSHPLDFRAADGEKLLGQSNQAGSFDNDAAVDVEYEGDRVTFTLTSELASALAEYICAFHPSMGGSIEATGS